MRGPQLRYFFERTFAIELRRPPEQRQAAYQKHHAGRGGPATRRVVIKISRGVPRNHGENHGFIYGGVHSHGGTPIAGWFLFGKIPLIWMMNRGSTMTMETPIWKMDDSPSTKNEP